MTRPEKGLPKDLTELGELIDFVEPPAVKTRHAKHKAMATEWVPQAAQDRADAEAALASAEREQLTADIQAMTDGMKGKSPKMPDLGPNRVELAEVVAREARRTFKAAQGGMKAWARDLEAEVARPEFNNLLDKAWAEFVSFRVKSDMRLSDFKSAEAVSDEAARLIESIALAGARVDGASPEEETRLRGLFKSRPIEMPNLTDVRRAMRGEQANTPIAKEAKARAEAKRSAEKVSAIEARFTAKARNPKK